MSTPIPEPFTPEPRDRVELPADTLGDLTLAGRIAAGALDTLAGLLAAEGRTQTATLCKEASVRLDHALHAVDDRLAVALDREAGS